MMALYFLNELFISLFITFCSASSAGESDQVVPILNDFHVVKIQLETLIEQMNSIIEQTGQETEINNFTLLKHHVRQLFVNVLIEIENDTENDEQKLIFKYYKQLLDILGNDLFIHLTMIIYKPANRDMIDEVLRHNIEVKKSNELFIELINTKIKNCKNNRAKKQNLSKNITQILFEEIEFVGEIFNDISKGNISKYTSNYIDRTKLWLQNWEKRIVQTDICYQTVETNEYPCSSRHYRRPLSVCLTNEPESCDYLSDSDNDSSEKDQIVPSKRTKKSLTHNL
ncbi:hypothetical protein THOM_1993 [Trachipleistophora hominis]|uniref:Uncharacterized protein n=1 Tax=Trachipleistophora hominis TaxID=72359 RepID=L7JUG4_TRAHO|nr:hypothetical protein THOM_1993 [Trachipleistophora hominis]